MAKKKIGIIGATGYTGSELVRILLHHPEVEIEIITSESRKGEKFSDVHSQFLGLCDMELESIDDLGKHTVDAVFLALPHGVSMNFVKNHAQSQFKIIDLSGDFRLSSPAIYGEWYKMKHVFPEGFENAVYGLPELYRDKIRDSRLVANPGCFPTSAILALAPLLKEGVIKPDQVVVDSKTGVTGAGVKPKTVTHFSNVNDNFKAYGVKTHRHSIEIQEVLSDVLSGESSILFTPHLLPVDRGILSTAYSKPKQQMTEDQVRSIYENFYKNEPFIRLRDVAPEIKNVRGTNFCDVFVTFDERTNTIISMAVIDNLVKGAAGAAVQNFNLMMGIDEQASLQSIPLQP
jgi:N-acetyl-gamma-glutamyl-phosphate reductase